MEYHYNLPQMYMKRIYIIESYQCNFQKGKATTDHIFVQIQVIEKFYELGIDLLYI